jgi:hypothetical protein
LFQSFANSPLNVIDPDGRDNMYGFGANAGQNAPVNFGFSMPVGGGAANSYALGTDPIAGMAGYMMANYLYNSSPLPMWVDAQVVADGDADAIDRWAAGLDLFGRSTLYAVGASGFFPKSFGKPCPPTSSTRNFTEQYPRVKVSKGTRAEVWERSKSPDGKVYDPSGREIKPGDPWELGHKPAHKFSDAQKRAAEQRLDIETWKKYQRDPDIYRPEHPSSNAGHQYESDW